VAFSIRVGGADMPITISLLNSFSGLAASVAGFALYDPLLVVVGAIGRRFWININSNYV